MMRSLVLQKRREDRSLFSHSSHSESVIRFFSPSLLLIESLLFPFFLLLLLFAKNMQLQKVQEKRVGDGVF